MNGELHTPQIFFAVGKKVKNVTDVTFFPSIFQPIIGETSIDIA